ncbi:hypothetical protein BJ912DRAFT_919248 [Pholiota molesta]|nr:hypothetical protein BJ912DRAFT_919248 [Pholiota molesta]
MLSSLETPRPLPPAKARRAMQKLSSSPPPAYGSPFTFPARSHVRQDILGSPMTTTFQMVGWDGIGEHALPTETPEDMAWVNEKSREELKGLLLKADGIIRERENELGITSAVCKGLYQNHVALKSKHEELLTRIPTSPPRSVSSPANLYHQPPPLEDDDSCLTASSSESALDLIRSPGAPSLLDKLEKLEKEATSTDQAGRRELKRLEKEIAFLREELEKTQARGDELEEKVQSTAVSEAWRRKKEREAKFRAMRNNRAQDEERKVRNFARRGPGSAGHLKRSRSSQRLKVPIQPTPTTPPYQHRGRCPSLDTLGSHEHDIISQLLVKVKELEETNAKILQQQSETANQLSAVQRDTAHMTRVYDCLSDQKSIDLQFSEDREEDEKEEREKGSVVSGQTIRFMSLKRTLANDVSFEGTCIVHPDFTSSGKTRKTVMGLFDVQQTAADEQEESNNSSIDEENVGSRLSVASSPWSEGHGHDENSSWSSLGGSGGTVSPSARLSPLHFFSPPSHALPNFPRSSELGQSWAEMQQRNDAAGLDDAFRHNHHLRASSLYDLSQMSVPPSPSPTSRVASRRASDELDYQAVQHALSQGRSGRDGHASSASTPRTATLLMPANSLRLSVEPPTPESRHGFATAKAQDDMSASARGSPPPRSPRVKLISETLRSRASRWADRRLRRSREREERRGSAERAESSDRAAVDAPGSSAIHLGIPKHLMNAVDMMVSGFDNALRVGEPAADSDAYNFSDADYEDGDTQSSPLARYGRYERAHMRRRDVGRGAYRDEFEFDDAAEPIDDARGTEVQLHTGTSLMRGGADLENQGVMLRVWLWIQFAIVVFVFLYAMAKRGPTIVLTEENKKAVVKRK